MILTLVLTALVSGSAVAGELKLTYVAADFFSGESDQGFLGNVEYAWSAGRLSGFGFAESGEYNLGVFRHFVDNVVDLTLAKGFYLSTEVGTAEFGDFWHGGVGYRLGGLRGAQKGLYYLNLLYYADITGDAASDQWKLSWLTKHLQFGSARIWCEGFQRRFDSGLDFGQI